MLVWSAVHASSQVVWYKRTLCIHIPFTILNLRSSEVKNSVGRSVNFLGIVCRYVSCYCWAGVFVLSFVRTDMRSLVTTFWCASLCLKSDVARRTKQLEAEMALGPGGAARWERIQARCCIHNATGACHWCQRFLQLTSCLFVQELGASLNVRFDSFIAENHPSFWPEMPLAM